MTRLNAVNMSNSYFYPSPLNYYRTSANEKKKKLNCKETGEGCDFMFASTPQKVKKPSVGSFQTLEVGCDESIIGSLNSVNDFSNVTNTTTFQSVNSNFKGNERMQPHVILNKTTNEFDFNKNNVDLKKHKTDEIGDGYVKTPFFSDRSLQLSDFFMSSPVVQMVDKYENPAYNKFDNNGIDFNDIKFHMSPSCNTESPFGVLTVPDFLDLNEQTLDLNCKVKHYENFNLNNERSEEQKDCHKNNVIDFSSIKNNSVNQVDSQKTEECMFKRLSPKNVVVNSSPSTLVLQNDSTHFIHNLNDDNKEFMNNSPIIDKSFNEFLSPTHVNPVMGIFCEKRFNDFKNSLSNVKPKPVDVNKSKFYTDQDLTENNCKIQPNNQKGFRNKKIKLQSGVEKYEIPSDDMNSILNDYISKNNGKNFNQNLNPDNIYDPIYDSHILNI